MRKLAIFLTFSLGTCILAGNTVGKMEPQGVFYLRPSPDSTDFEYGSGDTLRVDVVVSVSGADYPFYSYGIGNFLSYDTTVFSLVDYEDSITEAELYENFTDMTGDGEIQYSRMKKIMGGSDTGWVVIDSLGKVIYRLIFIIKEEVLEDTTQIVFSNTTISDSSRISISTAGMDTSFYIIEYGTKEQDEEVLKEMFILSPSFPNPATGTVIMKYVVRKSANTSLKIYDIAGKLVRTLVDKFQEPGWYSASWDSKDDREKKVRSGIYFAKFETERFRNTKKIVLMR